LTNVLGGRIMQKVSRLQGERMRAWTVDADDIRVAEDFDEALLHRTPEIDAFLNLDRDDKFIVIGTKGFGKTLLLKAKRILYQREGRATCLPAGNLLDKPIGDKIFGKEALAFLAASPLPWTRVWLTAVAVAILKHAGKLGSLTVNSKLAGLMADEGLRTVIDHLVRLLDFPPSDLQRCATDTDGHLVPRLRAVSFPVALFIDGVDEYFNKHIETRPSHPSVTGQLSPNVWHFAQLGLVQVAYELRRINHHLKVFAAVRKEAMARLQTTVMSQQYQGSAVDIVYPIEGLREIFLNNIRLEKLDRMVLPGRLRSDPVEAFLGRKKVLDVPTGEHEDAFAYVGRNTLLRPRDLMTIGQRLTALRPAERRDENRLKEAVNRAASEIVREYLTEIAPYVGDLELERCLRRIPGPILTRDDVERLFREHNADIGAFDERHVFCALYRVGLLGYVHHDWVRGEWVQRFLRPGEGTLEPDGVLPEATHYLVHPVLSDVIGRLNPAYLQRIDRVNIVGYGRPWRGTPSSESAVTTHMLCVLAGDVEGFGGLMRARADAPVRQALEEAVLKWAHGAVAAETRAGDAVWVAHEDPVALAQIARHMIDEVYRVPGQPRLRIALHYGEVQTRRPAGDGSLAIAGGDAVLCAARIEPHVEPGQIWASEEFRQELARAPSLWRTTPVGDERLNIKKGAEPDLWVRLYRLEF
jgi:class 3 adenylate cyclase